MRQYLHSQGKILMKDIIYSKDFIEAENEWVRIPITSIISKRL